jgi:hypothetical protein
VRGSAQVLLDSFSGSGDGWRRRGNYATPLSALPSRADRVAGALNSLRVRSVMRAIPTERERVSRVWLLSHVLVRGTASHRNGGSLSYTRHVVEVVSAVANVNRFDASARVLTL